MYVYVCDCLYDSITKPWQIDGTSVFISTLSASCVTPMTSRIAMACLSLQEIRPINKHTRKVYSKYEYVCMYVCIKYLRVIFTNFCPWWLWVFKMFLRFGFKAMKIGRFVKSIYNALLIRWFWNCVQLLIALFIIIIIIILFILYEWLIPFVD